MGVRIAEKVATVLITACGIGTIVAVASIFVFLVQVALPLFSSAEVAAGEEHAAPAVEETVLYLVDEYRTQTATLEGDGRLLVHRFEDGALLQELEPLADVGVPTAWSLTPTGRTVGFALEDGRVGMLRLSFQATFPTLEEIGASLEPGEHRIHDGGLLERSEDGRYRLQRLRAEVEPPLETGLTARIVRLAHTDQEGASSFCVWTAAGGLSFLTREERTNFLTGEDEVTLAATEIAHAADPGRGAPAHLLLTGAGDNILLVWSDGTAQRIDNRMPSDAALAETVDLVEDEGSSITAIGFLNGNTTLAVGDSSGRIDAWFRTKPPGAETPDGTLFVRAHPLFEGDGEPVQAFAPSPRSRLLAAGFEGGVVRLFQVTTEALLAEEACDLESFRALRIAPKEDAILALGAGRAVGFELDPRHSEATLASMFRPVWYEGFDAPAHSWQAEGATDEFEPKLGFVPLVFGTVKATVYSMLFGAPLALLAAVFTSEFLSRRLRVPIKSSIEVMASLPSVVLGFMAGSVIAPFAQSVLPAILATFLVVPFALLAGAYLWQLLPQGVAIRWAGGRRIGAIALALAVGGLGGVALGPLFEQVLFAGDVERWLDGQIGSSVGGWVFLLLPVSALLVVALWGPIVGPAFRRLTASRSRAQCAVLDGLRFVVGALATAGLALALGLGLDAAGFDPRGSVMDTYVQRNALVVGFVMGFAIIPIIYTLAEDALSSVPEHLRLASLGAGATPWQTAVRIVVPTAMSGIFSAVMIGLGRAVGETMIVLMATGNTPVMEWNAFNGFRTLSANIAVELPEAVKDSTHYRALFLAALVLFAMTFALNTLAEAVRQRFRKRSYQL